MRIVVLGLFVASAILPGCGGGGSGGAGRSGGLTVAISNPSSTVYTHGNVAIEVTVSGGTPDGVQLLKDGALLVTLLSPYRYNWDTGSTPEGSYQLVARVTEGGQSFTSESRTIVVDRTPPAVASRIPAPNATNISVDDPIVVGFTKPLLPASVTAASFALRSGSTPLPTTPLLSSDGRTVMLVRHTNLAVPATLTLTITSSITDLAGNALLGADAWSWSVPDWVAVGGAVNAVTGQDLFLFNFVLALDGSGKPVVAFTESDGHRQNVYVRQWTGNNWQPVGAALNADSFHNVFYPALALDGSGKPVVAFSESDGSHYNVYVRRWTGNAWQPVGGPINAISGQDTSGPVLAVDGSGEPIVGFYQGEPFHQNGYVREWAGNTWQPVGGPINAVPGHGISHPVMAVDGSGRPVVAFQESDGSHDNVYVRRWTGVDWQSVGGPLNADSRHDVSGAVLALDGNGQPIVAMSESNDIHYNVYVRRWTGIDWQSVGSPLNAVPGQNAVSPALAFDRSGQPIVAFQESDSNHTNVYVRRWTGTDWQSVGSPLNAVPGQDAWTPALALDGGGKPVVALYEYDGSHDNVYVRHSNQ